MHEPRHTCPLFGSLIWKTYIVSYLEDLFGRLIWKIYLEYIIVRVMFPGFGYGARKRRPYDTIKPIYCVINVLLCVSYILIWKAYLEDLFGRYDYLGYVVYSVWLFGRLNKTTYLEDLFGGTYWKIYLEDIIVRVMFPGFFMGQENKGHTIQ